MKKIFTIAVLLCAFAVAGLAQQKLYKASLFGIRSNGVYDNTSSIQGAIDYISANGGGILEFSVGRYVTGAVELKNGVDIKFLEGAVIVGSTNYYEYNGAPAVYWGQNLEGVKLFGKGVFEGRGEALLENIEALEERGLIKDPVVPTLICLKDCKDCTLENIIMRYPATEELYKVEGGSVTVEGCYNDIRTK